VLQCAWPAWLLGPAGPEFKHEPGSLSVHASQLNAYSENNISGRHRGFNRLVYSLICDCWLMLSIKTLSY